MQYPSLDSAEKKAEFHKLSNDTANRKYRRRSSAASSSDESPGHGQSSSPVHSREDPERLVEHHERRKDNERLVDRNAGWSQYGRGGDSCMYTDRHSTRRSRGYSRHDEYRKDGKRYDEDRYHQGSYHSGQELRSSRHYSHAREGEHGRSRDLMREAGGHPHDRKGGSGHRNQENQKESLSQQVCGKDDQDDKREGHKSRGGHKSENLGNGNDSLRKNDDSQHSRQPWSNGPRGMNERERKLDEWEANHDKDRHRRSSKRKEDKSAFGSELQESQSKRPKLFSSDRKTGFSGDVDEKQSSRAKEDQDNDSKANVGLVHAGCSEAANDLQAAKVAAMKAAELVNKNLVGVGVMSAEQKKKLLWGNKRTTTSEDSGVKWNTAMFGDRERQEKFNKLMGVKGEANVGERTDGMDGSGTLEAEKQKELQMDLEKQYTAGLRRRDGRTVGLGL